MPGKLNKTAVIQFVKVKISFGNQKIRHNLTKSVDPDKNLVFDG